MTLQKRQKEVLGFVENLRGNTAGIMSHVSALGVENFEVRIHASLNTMVNRIEFLAPALKHDLLQIKTKNKKEKRHDRTSKGKV